MPKFLLDENIRIEIKEFLKSVSCERVIRSLTFDWFSAEYAAKGVSNGRLASLAKEKSLVLVSRDSDFLNKSAFPPKEFSGMIVFVIHPPTVEKLVRALSSLLSEVKVFEGKLFAVGEEEFEIAD